MRKQKTDSSYSVIRAYKIHKQESSEESLYSSAVNYSGKKGLVEVVIINPHLAFR
ncbi:MAG: hypothetical protein NTV09_09145 [Bacteroidetes bacterium]|nr:hypothetical protein [Bacteroidota bacterium]